MSSRVQKITCCTLMALHLLAPKATHAQKLDIYTVKSVFIYHFIAGTYHLQNNPHTVFCTIGDDPFGSTIDNVAKLAPHKISLTIKRHISLSNIHTCNVVFISLSETPRLNKILGKINNAPILTISEINDFHQKGGMIEFLTTHDSTVQFIINRKEMNKQNLDMEVFVLESASIVIQ